MRVLAIILLTFWMSLSAMAQTAEQPITDPQLTEHEIEVRAREIGKSLRCVVCQSQSIEESNAPLAQDMRKLVRTRVKEGDSNKQVTEMMRARYGDYVLMKPPFQPSTYFLWLAPGALLILSLLWYFLRKRRPQTAPTLNPLSEDEKKRLAALLATEETRK